MTTVARVVVRRMRARLLRGGGRRPMKEEDVVKSAEVRGPRVQWGGDIGREREKGEEGSDSKPLKKGTRKARGMFKNRKTAGGVSFSLATPTS